MLKNKTILRKYRKRTSIDKNGRASKYEEKISRNS